MRRENGECVDIYIPRKCSVTSRLIEAKDHSAVQINVPEVNEDGVMVHGSFRTYAISGPVRHNGESDAAFAYLAERDGLLPKN